MGCLLGKFWSGEGNIYVFYVRFKRVIKVGQVLLQAGLIINQAKDQKADTFFFIAEIQLCNELP